jgi:hypothetical protein
MTPGLRQRQKACHMTGTLSRTAAENMAAHFQLNSTYDLSQSFDDTVRVLIIGRQPRRLAEHGLVVFQDAGWKKELPLRKVTIDEFFPRWCGSLVAGLSLFPSSQLSNSISKPAIAINPIGSGLVFFPHRLIDLLPQHPDFPRRGNSQPDLVATHTDHGYYNIVTDGETLAGPATQYQHGILLLEKVEKTSLGSESICGESATTSNAPTSFF